MLTSLAPPTIIFLLVASASAALLLRDISTRRLRERIGAVRLGVSKQEPAKPLQPLGIRPVAHRGEHVDRLMHLLQINPDIPRQNIIPWTLVIAIACGLAMAGFFYGKEFVGWPLAALMTPIDGLLVARFIFGWERARYQKVLLEQIPDVMALICRATAAGIPLSEALRNAALDTPSPSRDEFVRVVNGVAIGQPLEEALWKLHERVGLAEYAFFAVTIGLQAQTGGSLLETLETLQDMVRKRVALAKRGKALAAEARMSALVLAILPFIAFFGLSFLQPGFGSFFINTADGNYLLLAAFGFLATGVLAMRQLIGRSLAP
jgi:tight adherence protein B